MKVAFFAGVQKHTAGDTSFDADGVQNLNELVELLGERYGDDFKRFLRSDGGCIFLVNGKSIAMAGGFGAPLQPGDTVEILPFVDGG